MGSVALFLGGIGAGAAGAQAGCSLYGTDASGGNLLAIDATSGTATVVGSLGFQAPSLAMDPTSGVLYAGRGGGSPGLYQVDPASGAATLVGSSGIGYGAISGMTFAPDGTLYAAVNTGGPGKGADHLATVDATSGAVTIVGSFGDCSAGPCTIAGMESLAFDASGALRGVVSGNGGAGAPGLYTIDPASGAATFDVALVDAQGQSAPAGFASLEYCPCDGTLYAGTARTSIAANDGGDLVSIDPATGIFTPRSAASLTGGTSLGGLAHLAHPAVSTFRNGTGINPPTFVEVAPAVIGKSWRTTIDIVTPGAALSLLAAVPSGPLTVRTPVGELLIDVSTPPLGGVYIGAGTHSIKIPLTCGLIGFHFYSQGGTFRPGHLQLTNALDVVVGGP